MTLKLKQGKYCFLGIGGSGMAPLAEWTYRQGANVCGSDPIASRKVHYLRELGIPIETTQDGRVLEGVSHVIYSSAIQPSNYDLKLATERGLKVIHRSQFLADILDNYNAITVSGTHGKTTTSSLIAFTLEQVGISINAIIGGELADRHELCMAGSDSIFVAESDESDRSFLKYAPQLAIVTNCALDHLDQYRDLIDVSEAFQDHLNRIRKDGTCILGWDDPTLRSLKPSIREDIHTLTYGLVIGSEVRAINICYENGYTTFDAIVEKDLIRCSIPLYGKHNVQNALATLATCRSLEVPVDKACAALRHFPGVRRRLELVYQDDTRHVFDDYAHNPGKISACITALHEAFPDRKLIVIFQPHRYSRVRTMYQEFCSAFQGASTVILTPPYAAGEDHDPTYLHEKFCTDIGIGSQCTTVPVDGLEAAFAEGSKKQSVKTAILTVGAGDIWQVAHRF